MTVEEWLGENNQLGIDIWHKKYQQDDETFDEWLDRVSGRNQTIRKLIVEKKFLFGGRILSYRGMNKRGRKISLSNCYVITPPDDNIESIFECATKLARTYSYGGGCGVDISKLAPKGAKVNNAAKSTSGATSFMELYNLVTDLIGQNGRRGALMISISCDHPDLEDFIKIKSDINQINKANISIRITSKFMEAVENKEKFILQFTREETGETIKKEIDANEIFRIICEMNWDYAEPGVLFWNRIKDWNLLNCDDEFEYGGVNPCAEEPLPAGGSCLLGSINLSEFVTQDKYFMMNDFRDTVRKAVIALNEVLDEGLPLHPLQEQRNSVRDWKQIGLGIFGLADMLIKMGIRYGSKESIELCDKIGFNMADEAIKTSSILSKNKAPYPKYELEVIEESDFYNSNTHDDTKLFVDDYGLCNSQLLTIAPTGTISSMLGVSGGIEPIFETSYQRKTESLHGHDEYYTVYTPIVKEYMEKHGLKDVTELPDYFITSKKLNYKERIDMQSVWQKHIDASISSTVNVPNDFSVDDVMNLYIYAWKKGLKGVTIFRDGCKRAGVLTSIDDKSSVKECTEDKKNRGIQYNSIIPITRDEIGNKPLPGRTYMKRTACGKMYIHINHETEGHNIVEVFVDPSKSGGCAANADCLGRFASTALRSGITVESVIDTILGVKCSACTHAKGKGVKIDGISCGDAIAKAIKEEYDFLNNQIKMLKEYKPYYSTDSKEETSDTENKTLCPECGEKLTFEGGCNTCKNCGWSKCE